MSEVIKVDSEVIAPKYYTFDQNNSGGSFILDKFAGITHYVIVQAYTLKEAVERAKDIGLYFDGYGDCDCCGNRWYEPWQDEGTLEPEIYSEPAHAYNGMAWMEPGCEIAIHHLDGNIEWLGVVKGSKKK